MSFDNGQFQNQRKRNYVERAYVNASSNNNSDSTNHYQNYNNQNNSRADFTPPVPESLRPSYTRTYIAPEESEPSQYPPRIPSNYNIPPRVPPNPYRYEYYQNDTSDTTTRQRKERVYINPISEEQFEREKRKGKKADRSNISIPDKNQPDQSFFTQFFNFLEKNYSAGTNPPNTRPSYNERQRQQSYNTHHSFYNDNANRNRSNRSPSPGPIQNGTCPCGGFALFSIIIMILLVILGCL